MKTDDLRTASRHNAGLACCPSRCVLFKGPSHHTTTRAGSQQLLRRRPSRASSPCGLAAASCSCAACPADAAHAPSSLCQACREARAHYVPAWGKVPKYWRWTNLGVPLKMGLGRPSGRRAMQRSSPLASDSSLSACLSPCVAVLTGINETTLVHTSRSSTPWQRPCSRS